MSEISALQPLPLFFFALHFCPGTGFRARVRGRGANGLEREWGAPLFFSVMIEVRRILQAACVICFLKQTSFLYICVGKICIVETVSGLVIYFLELLQYLVYVCVCVFVM